MAKLAALALVLALGLVSTVSARHLLFNVGENSLEHVYIAHLSPPAVTVTLSAALRKPSSPTVLLVKTSAK